MKRLSSLALLVLIAVTAGSPALFADEMTEVYRQIYQQSASLQDKYNAIQNLIALDDRSVAPILSEALSDLILTQASYKSFVDKPLYGRTVQLVAAGIGKYKAADAAHSLWDVVQQVDDPLAQSEALMALGQIRALDYAERISKMLSDLNLAPTADPDKGEKLAFGCIVALDKLKDLRGFAPVFFASDGWYSQRTRQLALKALPNITDDPTDPVTAIITNETATRKSLALKLELGSAAPPDRKAVTAILALGIGHLQSNANSPEVARNFGDFRKIALRGLIQLGVKDPAAVDAERKSYDNGYDSEEQLLGLQALGVNGGDAAATALSSILKRLNDEVGSGLLDAGRQRMARAAIAAATATKNPIVRPVLYLIANNNQWSDSVMNDASAALKTFKQ
ncbi:MAG TPA: hypothetical protein VMV44_01835 [Rectinemataceae bacterium]|nr:hypothetical protein [Rectinemataceae bacterium]